LLGEGAVDLVTRVSVNSLRKVLLLQPDGPINTVNSPGARAPRFERVLRSSTALRGASP